MPALPHAVLTALASTRAPGNALSFWIRSRFTWSRGLPELPHEPKTGLFAYLPPPERAAAETRRLHLESAFDLAPLARQSTAALYRKSLYLIELWEKTRPTGAPGLGHPVTGTLPHFSALDVGCQDWHYVFALSRWLRALAGPRRLELTGIEIDAYERYHDGYTRRDYALASMHQVRQASRAEKAAQANGEDDESPEPLRYVVGDVLAHAGGPYDFITWLFPLVTRYETLLWGLPARCYRPEAMAAKLASILKPGGHLLVLTHTLREHALAARLLAQTRVLQCIHEAEACSHLVDFHHLVRDRRLSLWQRAR